MSGISRGSNSIKNILGSRMQDKIRRNTAMKDTQAIMEDDEDELMTQLDKIQDPFADDDESVLDHNYDIIGIKDEKSPFHEPIKKAFVNYY